MRKSDNNFCSRINPVKVMQDQNNHHLKNVQYKIENNAR